MDSQYENPIQHCPECGGMNIRLYAIGEYTRHDKAGTLIGWGEVKTYYCDDCWNLWDIQEPPQVIEPDLRPKWGGVTTPQKYADLITKPERSFATFEDSIHNLRQALRHLGEVWLAQFKPKKRQ